ncbi:MAG: chloramphenicol acetyltransferase [Chitinophagaceae bacterium]|nr:chloramphenicol acetyltransferase [Chitinophagaceae bacterium]
MDYTEVDISAWKRKEVYRYFRAFDSPFFNITANVDVTALYNFTKEGNHSFVLACLFNSTKAANSIEEFRYRIRGEKLVCYNKVDPGCTIFLEDETYRYCYFVYTDDFMVFQKEGIKVIKEIKANPDFDPRTDKDDIIYYSIMPWVSFTSIEHPKNHNSADSIPRIVFGKYFRENNRLLMPVSVQANHALMDGYHAGRYFNLFQDIINRPGLQA